MTAPVRVRLSTPAQVVSSVPLLMGFTPERSLVVLLLHGIAHVLTMRIDLDVLPQAADELVARLLLADPQADKVMLVIYEDTLLGHRDVSKALRRACKARLEVIDAVSVSSDRFVSYLCDNPSCCPPEGTPIDLNTDEALTMRIAGATSVGTRNDKAALVVYTGPTLAAGEAAVSPGSVLTMLAAGDEYANLAESLTVIHLRDHVLATLADANVEVREQALDTLCAMLRQLPATDKRAPEVTTTAAAVAYMLGDGGLTNILLDRQPLTSTLGQLLAVALENTIPPEAVRDIFRRSA